MGQKGSGFERFLAPSVSKIEEEMATFHTEMAKMNQTMDETITRVLKLEQNQKRFEERIDTPNDKLTTESQVMINNLNEMEMRDRDEIDAIKRFMDIAQRRLTILEAKMKELGQ